MKKLLVLISVSLAFVFSSCEKLFDDSVSRDNYARYRIYIENDAEWAKSFYITVSADPPTDYTHVDIGSVAQDGGTGIYDFKLPLDIYEGKTVYLKLYTGPNFEEAKYRRMEEIVVKKTSEAVFLRFDF
jgi:hypothetical protein